MTTATLELKPTDYVAMRRLTVAGDPPAEDNDWQGTTKVVERGDLVDCAGWPNLRHYLSLEYVKPGGDPDAIGAYRQRQAQLAPQEQEELAEGDGQEQPERRSRPRRSAPPPQADA